MKKCLTIALLLFSATCFSQQALPAKVYTTMRDSVNYIDVIMYQGKGGSISIEGPNVRFFNSFIDNKAAAKTNLPKAGMVMWQINGREFLSGDYFLGDSTGYVVTNKDGKEYVNLINPQGNKFLKGQIKQ